MTAETETPSDVAALAVQLLSAYLANNTVPSQDLPELIRSTREALTREIAPAVEETAPEPVVPAVSVRKSLASADHILSLIDGKPYKTLKRHLATHGLTPDSYRERYGLPASYPMVAPSFAARRREIAERIGLGNRKPAAAAPQAEVKAPEAKAPVRKPKPAAKPAQSEAVAAEAPKPKRAPARKPKAPKAEPKLAAPAESVAAVAEPQAKSDAPAKPARRKRMARDTKAQA